MQQNTTEVLGGVGNWLEMAMETGSQLRKEQKEATTKELAGALAARLGTEVGIIASWLEGVEVLAKYARDETEGDALQEERQGLQAALRAVRPLVEARLQRRLDRRDEELGASRCQQCGQATESQGRRRRTWRSTVGKLELARRYSWCPPCGQGQALAQQPVGLPEGDYTAPLEEICALMATTVPHGMAVALVGKLLGIESSNKGIEAIVEQRGQQVVLEQDLEARRLHPYEQNGLPREVVRPSGAVDKIPEVAYLEMDGVIVMTRQALPTQAVAGRGGKGRKYHVSGREVKNAVLYEGAKCAQESESRGCLLEKKYVSHLGEWQQFALLVWAQMLRLRFDQAKLLVVLSDGAEWIRQVCSWLPIPGLLILDLFHVKQRIWELAYALYGEKTPQAQEWAQVQCERIEQGQAQAVIDTLRWLHPKATRASDLLKSLITYLTNNLDRMDYPSYRAQGLRVGSGAVESANYHVTGARLKAQGMRWSEKGAAEMACLRTDLFNGIWESRTRQLLKAA